MSSKKFSIIFSTWAGLGRMVQMPAFGIPLSAFGLRDSNAGIRYSAFGIREQGSEAGVRYLAFDIRGASYVLGAAGFRVRIF